MPPYKHRFSFEEDNQTVTASLELDEPLPFRQDHQGSGFYRSGRLFIDPQSKLEIVLYHTPATAQFIYLHERKPERFLFDIIGLAPDLISGMNNLRLPGQLCLGSDRSNLIRRAIHDVLGAPPLREMVHGYQQHHLAVFPIAREGLKYEVTEALFDNYHYYTDEVILDAHHVFDSSVPVYSRKVEMTIFKDKDLDTQQHENIQVAFLADGIASGLVMAEVITRVKERFERLQRVEVIAPLATVRGLCRIARSEATSDIPVRVHSFETLLNALPPDFYYSAHFNIPEMHIRPDLEAQYRAWWGQDAEGNAIAETACAGYGWSEVFYSPRKQIEMINSQLGMRHNLTIADVVQRNIERMAS
ncbi:MAG: hypothetical protein HPY76_03725 [Anaerolineae bacterium]|nr:hypothetical protein [Anaerolineae bacterium]